MDARADLPHGDASQGFRPATGENIVVLAVFGTRPEAIKLAPVVRRLKACAPGGAGGTAGTITVKVCVTGQHRQMLDQVLDLFGIAPDYDLNVMLEGQTPSQVASAVLSGLEPVLVAERPHWVLVQGDTTSAAIGALAAFYARCKVGHVEAGLRTGDKWQPYPEEINRRVVGTIADLHFAPTQQARQNLLGEGVRDEAILVTGNTVIDALRWVAAQPLAGRSPVADLPFSNNPDVKLILVTAHRRENFGAPFQSVLAALRRLAGDYGPSRLHIVYPVHPNPNVREPAYQVLGGVPNITLVPPLDYLSFVHLMRRCHFVITDSGGIQEEAPGLGKPVLVLRDVTERPEAVEAGTVKLVGTDRDRVVDEAVRLLEDDATYQAMARAVNPYGDGRAAERIVAMLSGQETEPWRQTERLDAPRVSNFTE